jgi:uncharacterized protein (UPF0335 family)
MSMSIGKNTIQGKRLLEIIEQSEAYDADKKEIGELNTALMAAAKAEGFNPKAINHLKRRRKMKPHDRQESDDIIQAYSHALGMDEEPPLFRAISEMARDALTRESLLESFKALAPPEGDIILRMGSEPVRVYRDKDGVPHVEPYTEKTERAPRSEHKAPEYRKGQRLPRDVPDVSEDGAFGWGEQMFRDNKPITDNPFPFGDPRRARCDAGWRRESGSDGMGDSED